MTKTIESTDHNYSLLYGNIAMNREEYSNWVEFHYEIKQKGKKPTQCYPIGEYNLLTHELVYADGVDEDLVVEHICRLMTYGI